MKTIANVIWFIFEGAWLALGWLFAGLIMCITIIGIPLGVQCFKAAKLVAFPFGKEIRYGGGAGSLILNIIWMIFGGLGLAFSSFLMGCAWCVTIIGIPLGLQSFKMAKLALMPFGSSVVKKK